MDVRFAQLLPIIMALGACDGANETAKKGAANDLLPAYVKAAAAPSLPTTAAKALSVRGESMDCARAKELFAQIQMVSQGQIQFAANGDVMVAEAAWRQLPANAKKGLMRVAQSATACAAEDTARPATPSIRDLQTGRLIAN